MTSLDSSSPQRVSMNPPDSTPSHSISESASVLPSPPISPVSPTSTRAGATRVRIKPTRTQSQRQSQSQNYDLSQSHYQSETQRSWTRTRRSVPSMGSIVNGVEVGVVGCGGGAVSSPTASSPATPGNGSGDGVNTQGSASAAVKANRRQSSIAYYTPSSPSPWDTRPPSMSTVNGEPGVEVKGTTGKRDSSASGGGGGSKRGSVVMSARVGEGRGSASVCEVDGGREREPLTLVEKHADLLHFIAQKERKCLELRDQLAVHEKELAELKRKWERMMNRGFTSTTDSHSHPNSNSSPLLNSSLGGVALDGLKEGVRMIATGITEVIQDLEPSEKEKKSVATTGTPANSKPGHSQRESDSSTSVSLSTGTGSISHFSTSSRSSIWEGQPSHNVDALAVAGGNGEKEMGATAPSLSRTGSLNSRMHKRASRTQSKERTAPPSAFVSPVSTRSTNVDFGEFVSSPAVSSPGVSASKSSTKSVGSPPSTMHTPISPAESVNASSWMDNMGKKLEELQKGQVFSKSQKRASVLLAGVSHSIASALLPGPTATTPAPSRLSSPRVQSVSMTPSKGIDNWLDEEEEQTKHAGEVMTPVLMSNVTAATKTKTAKACKPNAVSSFDDDDWNW